MACNCRLCERHRAFEQHMDHLREIPTHHSTLDFFEELYEHLNHVEMEENHGKAIIDGSWPTADSYIMQHRPDFALVDRRWIMDRQFTKTVFNMITMFQESQEPGMKVTEYYLSHALSEAWEEYLKENGQDIPG